MATPLMVWYYAEGNSQRGPVSDEEFDELVARGRVHDETLVWQDGMETWSSLADARAQGHVKPAPPLRQENPQEYWQAVPPPPQEFSTGYGSTAKCAQCGLNVAGSDVTRFGNVMICSRCLPAFRGAVANSEMFGDPTTVGAPSNQFNLPLAGSVDVVAGILPRFVARLIDNFIIAVITVIAYFVFFDTSALQSGVTPDMTDPEMRPLLFMWVGFEAVYHALFIGLLGATPGKQLLRIRVAAFTGGRPSYQQAVVRAFSLAFLQALALFWPETTFSVIITIAQIACFASALFDVKRRTGYDFLAGTTVAKV